MSIKRRNISGIYIFDTLEGDERRKPTCIEDCTEEKREEWLNSLEKEALVSTVVHLCKKLREVCDLCDVVSDGYE